MSVPGDNPIRSAEDDVLARAPIAESFARQVLDLDASEGLVVGILGPWGSGKTSFVNLARDGLAGAGVNVLDFNPWMFSGAEQLVESFFVELSSQLKFRRGLEEIGNDLAEYGEAFAGLGWLPVVGPWIERGRGTAKVLGKYLSRRREGTGGRRKKLNDALAALNHPIVVVLDDIDRLSTQETRDIFKLVRLTASFPNIIYVLAFDRARVEQALTEQGIPGRDYLEKILQVAVDLPAIPPDVLNRQVFSALDQVLSEARNPGTLDQQVWPDVFMEIIRPLLRNMRDVRRYAAAVGGTLDALDDRVALADLLALEAIRVFLPDVFEQLRITIDALCTPSEQALGGGRIQSEHLKEAVDRLVEIADEQADAVRALVKRLFPFAQRHIGGSHYSSEWSNSFLRDRRVAHESILRLYLERVAGEQLTSFYDAERAWKLMTDGQAFEAYLRSLEPTHQEDVIAALESYQDEYRSEHVVPGTVALWNLAYELPDKPRGMFDFDPRMTVSRVSYRLLKSLPGQSAVEEAVNEILPQLSTLSSKREIVSQVGYQEGTGQKLVSEAAAKRLEANWRADVRMAAPTTLAREYDLLRVLYWASQNLEADESAPQVPDDPEVTLTVLQSAKTETRSQGMGTRAVCRTPVFAWDSLVNLYGDEPTLIERIEELKASGIEIKQDLAELIDKYLGGWRPNDWGDPEDDDDETEQV
jgi:hypothetical protein